MSASTSSIHIMALDGIVNVNSLFTLALFVGLTITNPDTALVGGSSGADTACAAGPAVAEGLISSHVHSFSCFLFSSLIALALKNIINARKTVEDGDNIDALAGGSNSKMIKLGTFGCGSSRYSIAAVAPLLVLVPTALLIYVSTLVLVPTLALCLHSCQGPK
ncbi:Maternal effect embryo arrest protein [Arachis hypogaea]|nr:Maternal effect embryo arrest protein [Arachis hypogaea]